MQATRITYTIALVVLATFAAAQDYDYEPSQSRAPRLQSSGFSGNAAPKVAPIAILKQINRHNEDGSYTYGYEGADGSFKIETKLPNGEVKGKYGYADDTGKVRVVEYGANKYGFQPAGEGITVAPPTIVDETTNKDGTLNEYADQGHYYEQAPEPAARPAPRPRPVQQQQFDFNNAPRFAPAPAPAPIHHAAPVPPRAQINGAAPVEIDYRSPPSYNPAPRPAPVHTFSPAPRPAPQRQQYAPAPVQEDIQYADPAPRAPARFAPAPAPQASFRPAPQQQPQFAPRPAPRPAPQGQRSGGVLDQLARDYALPSDSAAPLHDISFGYY